MAYDKKTGTITIASDDHKKFERDMFRHFEEVTRKLSQDPNCPPEIAEEHQKLRKANKALDDYEKLKAITDQARSLKHADDSQIKPSLGDSSGKTGGVMRWVAICLNVVLVLTVIYMFATKGAPRDDEWFMVSVLLAAPLASLLALTRSGGESLVGLYFKRKALEEKQRISNLGG